MGQLDRFHSNTEASLTTVTTMAVALHIFKCTLCKITFSTLNGALSCFLKFVCLTLASVTLWIFELSSSQSLKSFSLSDLNVLKVWHLCDHVWKCLKRLDRFLSPTYKKIYEQPSTLLDWNGLYGHEMVTRQKRTVNYSVIQKSCLQTILEKECLIYPDSLVG